jgi:hypothetical protein
MSDDEKVREIGSAESQKRQRDEKAAKRELDKIFRGIDQQAHKMLDKLLLRIMPELTMHVSQGRGFRVDVAIVNADGTPWLAEETAPPPETPVRDRLIILPHEQ